MLQMKNVEKKLRNIEVLARVQLIIIIALLIGLCAFATNIYNGTTLGEAIQAVEAQR